jgi:hypothetical protein
MDARIVSRIFSAIFSRWTVFIVLALFTVWHIHLRMDQLGSAQLQSTNVSAVTTMAAQ